MSLLSSYQNSATVPFYTSYLPTLHCNCFMEIFIMDDRDERLLIAKLEVSCWKDQLKQAVSHSQFSNLVNF